MRQSLRMFKRDSNDENRRNYVDNRNKYKLKIKQESTGKGAAGQSSKQYAKLESTLERNKGLVTSGDCAD